jgi:thiosulfate/3-mercaptopyruvate sulfurtransferase
MLISAAALPADATVLDVRWELGWPSSEGRRRYLEGHIPGAAFVDLETALSGPPGDGGRHPMPDAAEFGAAMRAAGVSGERPVVVYDAGNSMAAARGWWLLRYFGHPAVFVLDGGFGGWLAAGLAIERGAVAVEAGDFVPRAGGMPVRRGGCSSGCRRRRAARRPGAGAVPRRAGADRPARSTRS